MGPEGTAIGVDLGGTKLAVGRLVGHLADGEPAATHVVDYTEEPFDATDYSRAVEQVAARIRTRAGSAGKPTVGIAVAAWMTADRSGIRQAVNLGWWNRPFAADLAAVTGLPTILVNDADAAAWAEFRLAGSPGGAFAVLTLGTDVGGGVIVDGKLQTGASGVAGELGHLLVDPAGSPCVCGARGCLAVYASGKAMVAAARVELVRLGQPSEIDAADLMRLAVEKHPAAQLAIERAARAIAVASAQLSRILDHGDLVIGGGAARLGEPLLTAVQEALADTRSIGPVHPQPRVRLAAGGTAAGVLGAADLSFSLSTDEPARGAK